MPKIKALFNKAPFITLGKEKGLSHSGVTE